MEHDSEGETDGLLYAWNGTQKFGKWTETIRNRRTNRDHPENSIVVMDLNAEKSPGALS